MPAADQRRRKRLIASIPCASFLFFFVSTEQTGLGGEKCGAPLWLPPLEILGKTT
jgi:hypothetical protein